MPHFKPLPILTVFSLASLAILIALGTWQLQRMSWKSDLIEQYDIRGSVSSFREALCAEIEGTFGPSVTAAAPLSGAELRYYDLRDEAGWVRISLMPTPRCSPDDPPGYLFIESAFETLRGGHRTTPEQWRIDALPEPRGFGSRNDMAGNEWYVFDRSEMAQAMGVEADQVMDVWARSDLGMPTSLVSVPPAKHLGYALTWFGLALALLGVYIALHIGQGRLRWH